MSAGPEKSWFCTTSRIPGKPAVPITQPFLRFQKQPATNAIRVFLIILLVCHFWPSNWVMVVTAETFALPSIMKLLSEVNRLLLTSQTSTSSPPNHPHPLNLRSGCEQPPTLPRRGGLKPRIWPRSLRGFHSRFHAATVPDRRRRLELCAAGSPALTPGRQPQQNSRHHLEKEKKKA